jgi:Protein of unknown function (DUF5818)
MINLGLSLATVLAFFVATAMAQTSSSSSGSSSGSNSSMGQGQTSPDAGNSRAMGQSPEGTNMPSDQNSQPTASQGQSYPNSSGAAQGTGKEHKMKGCVQSQGGQYVLETKHGKAIPLTGQDVSAHVGHEVAVHGTWSGGSSDMSGSSASNAGESKSGMNGGTFNVTSVDVISETCSGSHSKGNGTSGSQPQ